MVTNGDSVTLIAKNAHIEHTKQVAKAEKIRRMILRLNPKESDLSEIKSKWQFRSETSKPATLSRNEERSTTIP